MSNNTVLIVDDDAEILYFYQKIFRGEAREELDILGNATEDKGPEIRTLTFSDPFALLGSYQEMLQKGERCPVCIIDMRMPELNGLDTAKRLRMLDPHIDIVISTAFSDVPIQEIRRKLVERIFVVRKPFPRDEFYLLVHSLMDAWNARRELVASEARHQLLEQNMTDCVCLTDQNGKVQYATPSAMYFFGQDAENLIGKNIASLFSAHDAEMILGPNLPLCTATIDPSTVHDVLVTRVNGSQIWVGLSGKPVFDVNDRIINLQFTLRDANQRKKAERELLEEKLRLHQFLEATRAATWEWDVRTGETIFNDRWAELLGYTLQELAPLNLQTWERLVHPEDLIEAHTRLKAHFAHVTPFYDFEYRMMHKDGNWHWIHDRGKVVSWQEDGSPKEMRGTHTNVHERHMQMLAEIEKIQRANS